MKSLLQKMPITIKLTFCVVSLIGSELLVARTLGLIEDHEKSVMQSRSDLCEAIAIQVCQMDTVGSGTTVVDDVPFETRVLIGGLPWLCDGRGRLCPACA